MLHKNMLNPTALTKTKSSSTTDHNQINTNGGITGGINFSKSPYGIQVNQGKKKVSQMGLGVNESKRIWLMDLLLIIILKMIDYL
jgi:hypothetical protein